MFGGLTPPLRGAAPHPMRYVTGLSPAISNCCHRLFIFPFPSGFKRPVHLLPPYVCPQRRTVPVSLPSASLGEDEEETLSVLIVFLLLRRRRLAAPAQRYSSSF